MYKDDIVRLDEGEFLNDNLISFYLKYLHNKLENENKAVADKMYFFNSFFYDKLKNTNTKGRGIHYDGVKSWTSKIDLLSYDYIIVPVNESTHWWVAIICNAKKLLPRSDEEAGDESRDGFNALQGGDTEKGSKADEQVDMPQPAKSPSSPTKEPNIVEPMSQISLDDGEKDGRTAQEDTRPGSASARPTANADPASPTAAPSNDNIPDSAKKARRFGKRHSAGPPLKKYSPSEPRIITLDSLDNPHSPATGNLKMYLIHEIKERRGLEIDNPGSLGMTAKGIPVQDNFSDCGVYLLAYVQEFVKDPETFVRKILQREACTWDVDARKLRNDLRDLILDMHKTYQDEEEARRRRKKNSNNSKESKLPPNRAQAGSGPSREPSRPLTEPASRTPPASATVAYRDATSLPAAVDASKVDRDGSVTPRQGVIPGSPKAAETDAVARAAKQSAEGQHAPNRDSPPPVTTSTREAEVQRSSPAKVGSPLNLLPDQPRVSIENAEEDESFAGIRQPTETNRPEATADDGLEYRFKPFNPASLVPSSSLSSSSPPRCHDVEKASRRSRSPQQHERATIVLEDSPKLARAGRPEHDGLTLNPRRKRPREGDESHGRLPEGEQESRFFPKSSPARDSRPQRPLRNAASSPPARGRDVVDLTE